MWFARFFGGRGGQDDEQPTATPTVPRQEALPSAASRPAATTTRRRANDAQRKGFDPYNSGAFQRNAWERIDRY